ncbi:DUF4265 domain-containing protein [Streptomyces sp. NPDC046759]|uniref:DUF4265 domain-containing protein n=1 Tax=Streptomyces sp. NPDC046759 TaxID=3155019 RepID=UPI0033D5319C
MGVEGGFFLFELAAVVDAAADGGGLHLASAQAAADPAAQSVGAPASLAGALLPPLVAGALCAHGAGGIEEIGADDRFVGGFVGVDPLVGLDAFDLPGMLEQLWLREVGVEGSYEVCCIPFYAYGLALGDVVEKGESETVNRVVKKSGRRVLRVLFAEPRPLTDSRSALRRAVESAGLLSEWNGDRHVAIDVPDVAVMQPVFDSVQEIQNGTAFWEWSDAKEFRSA